MLFFLQRTQERVRNSRDKRAISVRAIEGLLYLDVDNGGGDDHKQSSRISQIMGIKSVMHIPLKRVLRPKMNGGLSGEATLSLS